MDVRHHGQTNHEQYAPSRGISITMWLYHTCRVMSPKHAEGMTNSGDPDQNAPSWSHNLSENFRSLRYILEDSREGSAESVT